MRGGSNAAESVEYLTAGIVSVIQNTIANHFPFFRIAGFWIPGRDVCLYKLVLSSEFAFQTTATEGMLCGLFKFPVEATQGIIANFSGGFFTVNTAQYGNGINVNNGQPLLLHTAFPTPGAVASAFSKCNGISWNPYEGFKIKSNEAICIGVSNGFSTTNVVRGTATIHYRVDQLLPVSPAFPPGY